MRSLDEHGYRKEDDIPAQQKKASNDEHIEGESGYQQLILNFKYKSVPTL